MELLSLQKEYFQSGATLPVEFRIRQLKTLYQTILAMEEPIQEALLADLGKSQFESYETEIGFVLAEITHAIRHLKSWARPKGRLSPLFLFPSKGRVQQVPYGSALILSPWNYPFQLAVAPLVSSIAAGNCTVIKPSELAPRTAEVLGELIDSCFEKRFCAVLQGGAETAARLTALPFDFIFFTGSSQVGKKVLAAASEHLTPVVLELGGKSPCIVDSTADIPLAARRIAWGKSLCAGQTCVAPDYLFVDRKVKGQLVEGIERELHSFFGDRPERNPQYPKLINDAHFERISALLAQGNLLWGGGVNPEEGKIAPTLIDQLPEDSPLLTEEVFGPILPVVTYDDPAEILPYLQARPKPLALYLFTRDKDREREILSRAQFGGGCVNDTVLHLSSPGLPFGGVGASGMGSCHGKAGFEAFSHPKSVLHSSLRLDLPVRYPPYSDHSFSILRRFLR